MLLQLSKLNLIESLNHFDAAMGAAGPSTAQNYQHVSNTFESSRFSASDLSQIQNIGYDAIRRGTVAAVIMSGGQGTRLGYHGPKGMYHLGLPSDKTIFQLHIEKIRKVQMLSGATTTIPIYIMTSDMNHEVIECFFRDNAYFGCNADDFFFFQQGLEPCFEFDGKIIIESPSVISMAPDGNGGIYKALQFSGAIRDMHSRGVEHLHIYGIDNVLTMAVDPLFLGLCIQRQAEVGNKVVWRKDKNEKVGVSAELNGRLHVLEYSELSPELANETDATGKLLFGAANICNHYLNVAFLIGTVFPNLSSSYHIAKKKIPYWDSIEMKTVTPVNNNGVKLEMFILILQIVLGHKTQF